MLNNNDMKAIEPKKAEQTYSIVKMCYVYNATMLLVQCKILIIDFLSCTL